MLDFGGVGFYIFDFFLMYEYGLIVVEVKLSVCVFEVEI